MNGFRVMWIYFRVGAMNEMQYRVNFFLQLLQSTIAIGTGLIALALVYSYTDELGGWSSPELLAVLGVYTLMGGVIKTFIQPNMERIMGDVQEGTLDFALTKPEDSQLIVSVREIRIWQTVDILLGLILLSVAVYQLQMGLGLVSALAFVASLLLGGIMIYSFWLMLTTIAFWAVRIHEMVNLFQGLFQAGRFPVDIYPLWLETSLTFLVPIAFAITVPAEALTGRLTPQTLLGALALALVLFTLARIFWRRGLRQYSGASA
jgi:ABC-2 type transport system permease protein